MKNKRVRSIFTLLFLLLFCVAAQAAYSIWSFSSVRHLEKTDAAIVLGAAVWDQVPSPVFQRRIDHAIHLYHSGNVTGIVFTGGSRSPADPAESEVARAYAIEHGVDAADIRIETKSRITEENLRYAQEAARDAGWRTFVIVSDPLHMKRSLAMARDLGITAYPSPTTTTAYRTLQTQVPFFLRELFYYLGYQASKPVRWLGLYP